MIPPHQTQTLDLDFGDDRFPRNLLPHDGEAIDHGIIFEREEAERYFAILEAGVPWRHDEVTMFGKHIVTARKVAWFGDRNYDYTYSGKTRTAMIWTRELREIKATVERLSGAHFNSCLLNCYADGTQGMGWHQDDEKELKRHADIASVSFGAERRFDFRHKRTREKISLQLQSGSLLVMRGSIQENWQHQIPKSLKVIAPRINLTFRKMSGSESPTERPIGKPSRV